MFDHTKPGGMILLDTTRAIHAYSNTTDPLESTALLVATEGTKDDETFYTGARVKRIIHLVDKDGNDIKDRLGDMTKAGQR